MIVFSIQEMMIFKWNIFEYFQQSTANPDLAQEDTTGFSVFFWWMCGITLLTMALFISARMGIYQEVLYKLHGKHPREALYVTVSYLPIPTLTFTPRSLPSALVKLLRSLSD